MGCRLSIRELSWLVIAWMLKLYFNIDLNRITSLTSKELPLDLFYAHSTQGNKKVQS